MESTRDLFRPPPATLTAQCGRRSGEWKVVEGKGREGKGSGMDDDEGKWALTNCVTIKAKAPGCHAAMPELTGGDRSPAKIEGSAADESCTLLYRPRHYTRTDGRTDGPTD